MKIVVFSPLLSEPRVGLGPDARGRVEDDDVADDQEVEELPQGGQPELLRRGRQLEPGEVVADMAGGDPDERDLAVGMVAPGEQVRTAWA